MTDYSETSDEELLLVKPLWTAFKLKVLRIELLKRAMAGNAVNNSHFNKLMAKVGEVDVFLSGIGSRRMFWIAIVSLALTAIVSGFNLYLRFKCP